MKLVAGFITATTLIFVAYLFWPLIHQGLTPLVSGALWGQGYWDYVRGSYHSLAMVFGSVAVAVMALALAIPIGLGAALYLAEFAGRRSRMVGKILVELLAGVPSVIYGLLGITVLLPLLQPLFVDGAPDSLLAGGLLLAIMVLPTFVTFADDALRCVAADIREQGLALGLSHLRVLSSLVLPEAIGGLLAAAALAFGRAIGETIAIYFVIGRTDQWFRFADWSLSYLIASGQTLTTKLSGSELAIAYGDPQHWSAMMALGLVLWLGVSVFAGSAILFSRRRL